MDTKVLKLDEVKAILDMENDSILFDDLINKFADVVLATQETMRLFKEEKSMDAHMIQMFIIFLNKVYKIDKLEEILYKM